MAWQAEPEADSAVGPWAPPSLEEMMGRDVNATASSSAGGAQGHAAGSEKRRAADKGGVDDAGGFFDDARWKEEFEEGGQGGHVAEITKNWGSVFANAEMEEKAGMRAAGARVLH